MIFVEFMGKGQLKVCIVLLKRQKSFHPSFLTLHLAVQTPNNANSCPGLRQSSQSQALRHLCSCICTVHCPEVQKTSQLCLLIWPLFLLCLFPHLHKCVIQIHIFLLPRFFLSSSEVFLLLFIYFYLRCLPLSPLFFSFYLNKPRSRLELKNRKPLFLSEWRIELRT